MRADAGLHADPTRRQICESGLHLATRPLLPPHDGTALILADDVERVLADIDADHGGRNVEFLRHGVLLVLSAPLPASRAGRARARPDHPINGHHMVIITARVSEQLFGGVLLSYGLNLS